MTVHYTTTQWPVKRFVDWRISAKPRLRVPKHQRGYVWDAKHRTGLIDTIMRNLPISSVTLSTSDLSGSNIYYIEDGNQRIETFVRFCTGKFSIQDQYFEDLPEDVQFNIYQYNVPVLIYSGASDEERIEIFDRLQNGVVLSSGERFHSMRFLSPLVQYACETLLLDDAPNQEDMGLIWGLRRVDDNAGIGDGTKRYSTLRDAVCLAAGTLWGPECFSEKYDQLREKLRKPLSDQQKEKSRKLLNTIIGIYKKAQQQRVNPGEDKLSAKKLQDSFWNPKHFTGYILFSLWEEHESKWSQVESFWVNFLISYRKRPLILKEKLLSMTVGYKTTEERLKAGWFSLQGRNSYIVRQEEEEEEEDDA